jgi:hypothetical protein
MIVKLKPEDKITIKNTGQGNLLITLGEGDMGSNRIYETLE